MRNLFLVVCLLCLFASMALAQGKVDSQWNCAKAADGHSINVGDQPNHAYAIAQFNCTATKGEVEGLKEKEGTGTEFDDVKGSTAKVHGVFVETLSNGDKLHINYQGAGTLEKWPSSIRKQCVDGHQRDGEVQGRKRKGHLQGQG